MWWIDDGHSYSVWFVDPYENGVDKSIKAVKLPEDYQEKLCKIQNELGPNYSIHLNDEGEFYGEYIGPIEEDKPVYERLADALKDGINSI